MSNKEILIDTIKGLDVKQNGSTLTIKSAEIYDETKLFTDPNLLKLLGTKACHTANGIYELILGNCDIKHFDISKNAHPEIYLSLSGLACEIFLKSLIYFEGSNCCKKEKNHKIDELFAKISATDQATIRAQIPEIDAVMPQLTDLFLNLRYDFELLHIKGDYLNVFDFMELLHKICNSKPKVENDSIRVSDGTLYL